MLIPEGVYCDATSIIGENVTIGKGTKIWAFVQIGDGAVIGENCTIGNGVYIDRDVKIGNNVMIHNHALLYRPLIVYDDVFIGPQVANANDPSPISHRIRDISDDKPTIYQQGCRIGMASSIAPSVSIGRYAFVHMRSLVLHSVPDYCLVKGHPARFIKYVCKCGIAFQRVSMDDKTKEFFTLQCTREGCEAVITVSILAYDEIIKYS